MRSFLQSFRIAVVAGTLLAFTSSPASAGRVGGPLITNSTAPPGMSVFFEITFSEGDRAVVNVVGDGTPALQLFMYDADGHVSTATSLINQQTVTMNVYRTGVFRVEVRNIDVLNGRNFSLRTN